MHSSATRSPVRVAQLALPALISQARTRPFASRRFRRATSTGAATTRFLVKTAAADAGVWGLEGLPSGSATLVVRDLAGVFRVLNSPMDSYRQPTPGGSREVYSAIIFRQG